MLSGRKSRFMDCSQKSKILYLQLDKNQVGIDKSAGLLKTLKIENQIKGDKCFHTIIGN